MGAAAAGTAMASINTKGSKLRDISYSKVLEHPCMNSRPCLGLG